MADNRPIGIFDSGLGGLTVVRELIKILPRENLVYLGDTARIPYGTRSNETITKFSFEDANFLLKQNVKCIIIACNTSSAIAGHVLKKKLKIPVFDVVSSTISKMGRGRIGVIGTRATIASGAYGVPFAVACPLLVPFIEEGEIKNAALKMVIKNYLRPLKAKKIDALILGCTHYPIIANLIRKEMGKSVELINPEKLVVKDVAEFLRRNNMAGGEGEREYFVTDLTNRFSQTAEMFLGHKINAKLTKN